MELSSFQKRAYTMFGERAQRSAHKYPQLSIDLQKAHIPLRPEVYLSSIYLSAVAGAIFGTILVAFIVASSAAGIIAIAPRLLLLLLPLPMIFAFGVHFGGLMLPQMTGRGRAKDIDAKLPYALNYLSTMANAGATPEQLFGRLADQDLYGEVAREAAWVDRDINLLGVDVLTALGKGIDRSPSAKFQDLMQGIITVLTSGGDLKEYLMSKSEQFLIEGRQENQRFMDSMGVMAESFVVVVVAAPLFVMVLLSVMTMFGTSGDQVLKMGYMMVLVMLPLSQLGFGWMIKSMTPEA